MLRVLDLFDVEHPDWTVEEAAAELGYSISTAYRYVARLAAVGMLASFGAGRYVLGPTITRYDRQLRLTDPLISSARQEMDRLAQLYPGRIVVFLCRLYRDQVMCVHQAAVNNPPFEVAYERGRPMPLLVGSASKVILAHLPGKQVRSLFKHRSKEFATEGLGDTWKEVRAYLRNIRVDGFRVSTSELDKGMRGVAVPLRDPAGAVIGSLCAAAPTSTMKPSVLEVLISEQRLAASRIEAQLVRVLHSRGRAA